jgi:multicomponent Na+:H+ antiporter subunit F
MIGGAEFLELAINIALGLLSLAFLFVLVRILRGPTLPDRILALDMLLTIGIGYIAVIAIKTGYALYLDIAISLALVGFLATVAFARFVLQRWKIQAERLENEKRDLGAKE